MKTRYVSITVFFAALFLTSTTALVAQNNWIAVSEDCYSYKNLLDPAPQTETHNTWELKLRSGTIDHHRDVYLKFSLDGTDYMFPEDVKSAYLQLTIDRWYQYGSSGGKYANFSIYDVGDNSWDETTLTWDNAPWSKEDTGEPIATLCDSLHTLEQVGSQDPVKPMIFDITDYVKGQLSKGNLEFSIVISDTTYGSLDANQTDGRYFSKDCIGDPDAEKDPNSTYFPYLVINENPRWVEYDWIAVSEDCYSYKNLLDPAPQTETHNTWELRLRSGTIDHMRDTYLKFSLDGTDYMFPEDVKSAYLQLTIDRWYQYGSSGGKYANFSIYNVGDNSWDETTLTWDNAPWSKEDTGEPIATLCDSLHTLKQVGSSDPVKPMIFDVTDYVKGQLSEGNLEFSMVISDTTYGSLDANQTDGRYFSKDCIGDPDAEKDPDATYFPCLFIKGLGETGIESHDATPSSFSLSQNYPNPFNPVTTISFSIAKTGVVDITVVDLLGRKIRSLLHEVKGTGAHQVIWNGLSDSGQQVASGLYFTRVSTEGQTRMIKMLLVR